MKAYECEVEKIHKSKVEAVKAKLIGDDDVFDLAELFKVFGDSTRTKILSCLEISELCVCDISSLLNMTKSAVSHQLKNLREMNLIKSRKVGKEVWYTLADEHVSRVFDISLEHIMELKSEEDN